MLSFSGSFQGLAQHHELAGAVEVAWPLGIARSGRASCLPLGSHLGACSPAGQPLDSAVAFVAEAAFDTAVFADPYSAESPVAAWLEPGPELAVEQPAGPAAGHISVIVACWAAAYVVLTWGSAEGPMFDRRVGV